MNYNEWKFFFFLLLAPNVSEYVQSNRVLWQVFMLLPLVLPLYVSLTFKSRNVFTISRACVNINFSREYTVILSLYTLLVCFVIIDEWSKNAMFLIIHTALFRMNNNELERYGNKSNRNGFFFGSITSRLQASFEPMPEKQMMNYIVCNWWLLDKFQIKMPLYTKICKRPQTVPAKTLNSNV